MNLFSSIFFFSNNLGSSESSANNRGKHTRGSHRRKSSSSSFCGIGGIGSSAGDSLRRRKRIDTECTSLHGSGLSLFEPLQVDVSTPSTNTVILTPSKITIEHSSDYEGGGAHEKTKPNVNGRTTVKRNRYVSSPIQWTYAHHGDDMNGSGGGGGGNCSSNNRTADFIEIVSEPEDVCRSHSKVSTTSGTGKSNTAKRMNNGTENTPKKPNQYCSGGGGGGGSSSGGGGCDDPNTFSIWELAKDNNNEQTIIFHHKSDDKCCDNYCCPRTVSDTELEMFGADRSGGSSSSNTYKIINDNDFGGSGKQNCCTSTSSLIQLDQLNNLMPSTSNNNTNNNSNNSNNNNNASTNSNNNNSNNNNNNSNNNSNTNSTALVNFQKNNISQSGSHRFLDLSSDIRRYSKITNFEQQNASNLLPNYLSRSSNTNLNEPILPQSSLSSTSSATAAATAAGTGGSAAVASTSASATVTSFELFNIPSTSMYDKPFGNINLTTQNHFETQSFSGKIIFALSLCLSKKSPRITFFVSFLVCQ